MRLRIGEQADADLDDIWMFILRESGSAEIATRALKRITEAFNLLVRYPLVGRNQGSARYPDLRRYPSGRYVIHYRVANEALQILRVVHGSRVDFVKVPGE